MASASCVLHVCVGVLNSAWDRVLQGSAAAPFSRPKAPPTTIYREPLKREAK